jgi:hypothetical protein
VIEGRCVSVLRMEMERAVCGWRWVVERESESLCWWAAMGCFLDWREGKTLLREGEGLWKERWGCDFNGVLWFCKGRMEMGN